LLAYRDADKKISTYGENLFKNINQNTGRLHAEFNQLGTHTGRFSSSNPNMQNIPRENRYRNAYVARPGHKIITADYSQEELRLLAAVSRELEMINAFIDGIDLHKKTASILFSTDVDLINKEQRSTGKTLNFAVVYGSSEYGLYKNFGIPLKMGKNYLEKFFSGYPRLNAFKEKAGDIILSLGYSITPLGRKRFFKKKILYKDYYEKVREESAIKRAGVNHIIQGGSADIIKLAMVDIDYNKPYSDDELRILLQVHDELVFEVREDLVDSAVDFIRDCMVNNEQKFLGNIPAVVDIYVGDCWNKE
jgi:DNA polymerase-1